VLRLLGRRGPLDIGAIVVDLDRTLTDENLRAVPEALAALDTARQRGVNVVLATGRTRQEIVTRASLLPHFDGLVLESGGVVGRPGDLRSLVRPEHIDDLARWLEARRIDYERGDTCLSLSTSDGSALGDYPSLALVDRHLNRDRIDITPSGVSKASGLQAVLPGLVQDGGRVLAFADGENDHALFRVADYRVAVVNAVPELKAVADETTDDFGGRGVARFLQDRLLAPPR
jgi:hydroxymethylpyrimidine pyrophosphatase-like HAD family hydrolase